MATQEAATAWMLNAPIAIAVCVGVLAWDIRTGVTAGVVAFIAEAALVGIFFARITHMI